MHDCLNKINIYNFRAIRSLHIVINDKIRQWKEKNKL